MKTTRHLLPFIIIILVASSALAPADFLQDLQRSYEQYRVRYQPVRISMAFNQPLYAPGDTAFFAIWYTQEDLTPVKGNQLINVDLIAGNGSTVQRARFKVKEGKGNNQLAISKRLPPGEYRLLAYTDWMKNAGDSWFYQKKLRIVTKKKLATSFPEQPGFYPEGGQMVEGYNNRIALVGPPAVEYVVRETSGGEVARVTTDSTGFAIFMLSAKSGQSYSAEAGGKTFALPANTNTGVGVRLEVTSQCDLVITIPRESGLSKKDLFAVVLNRGAMVVRQRIKGNDEETRLNVPYPNRGESFHQLFVFTADGQVVAERVFIPNPVSTLQVKLQVPAEVKQRDKISSSWELVDASGNPVEATASVTVVNDGLFPGSSLLRNLTWTDLPALSERAERFGTAVESNVNDFLITQKWQRINWENVLKEKSPAGNYAFQSEAKLKGMVISPTKGTPPPDSTVIISYLHGNNVGFEAYTRNGQFEVPFVFDFWGDDKVFCTLQSRGRNVDRSYNITIPKDTISITARWETTELNKPSVYGDYALSKELVTKSYAFFGTNQQQVSLRDKSPNAPIEEEFNGADQSVNVADYVVFPKMEDLLREIVPFAGYRKRGTEESVRISYRWEGQTRTYRDDPLYVIDGILTKNTTYFCALKPEDIVTIKVINNPNKLAQLSRLGENGVIFVETRKRDRTSRELEPTLFPVIGLSKQALPFVVQYNENSLGRRLPDLRSTLLWNPMERNDINGRASDVFFASDDVGTVRVLVRGITTDGRPFYTEATVKVAFNASPK